MTAAAEFRPPIPASIWPSTAASRGTPPPSGSRSADSIPRTRTGDRLRRLARRGALLRGGRQGDPRPQPRALPHRGEDSTVRLDPAAYARTGIGPAAFGEFQRVFGPRSTAHWPSTASPTASTSSSCCSTRGFLLIHPRCTKLRAAFQNYPASAPAAGEWLDEPEDPQHPHEDLMDALRGGVRDRFPEGRLERAVPRLGAGVADRGDVNPINQPLIAGVGIGRRIATSRRVSRSRAAGIQPHGIRRPGSGTSP